MQHRYHISAPSDSDMSEILHMWHTALATARASEEADLYAWMVVLVMESLEHYTTIPDLITAYFSPHAILKARVLALCGEGESRLEPWVVMGAACALQLRQLMDDAVA
jgi:hypothetical protein